MPKKPPRKWFRDCVKGVNKSKSKVTNPEAVCGDIWWHKKTKKERNVIIKKMEKK